MIGVCPGCGKPFRVEQAKSGEGLVYCEDVCISPAAMPTGVRMMPDQVIETIKGSGLRGRSTATPI